MKHKAILLPIVTILVAALVLAGLSAGLAGLAEKNAQAELTAKLQTILPDSTTFTEEPYTGKDPRISRVFVAENGVVVETVTSGYAGDITMLIGVSNDGKVTGLQVRYLEDTFGLGAEALTDADFLSQFLNTDGNAEVGVDVDGITGATVTSRAVARSVKSAVSYVTGADEEADASSGATP